MSRTHFGTFVLDQETRELLRAGCPIPLSPKAFQLLGLLVDSRPRAVSKIILQERLWPDTFVVEKNLTNLVVEIREALGDDPRRPRFVRTVQRFGYAFRAPEDGVGPDGASGRRNAIRFRLWWANGQAKLGDGSYVLGRDPDLEIFLDSPGISRRHAVITVAGQEATIEDLASKNGTFVADRRLACPTPLTDGDLIRLGSVTLTLSAVRAWESTRTEDTGRDRRRPSFE